MTEAATRPHSSSVIRGDVKGVCHSRSETFEVVGVSVAAG